jgi:hypothetical protein
MLLLKNRGFGGCNFMVHKAVFDRVGGFDEQLNYRRRTWIFLFACLTLVLATR